VVALHHVTRDGACVQTASIGHEGMVGLALFLGGGSITGGAVVHTGGHGWRIAAHALVVVCAASAALRLALLQQARAQMAQMTQTAACYRHHSIEQQLAGWLLETAERLPDAELVMTQDLLSSLLGVRRESITQAAGRLQALQLIRYRRGHIAVLHAPGLRDLACECHGVVRAEMRRVAETEQHLP
jgi:CRP-like cAMP-binding protein